LSRLDCHGLHRRAEPYCSDPTVNTLPLRSPRRFWPSRRRNTEGHFPSRTKSLSGVLSLQ
jgi:hypothetical protein